MGVGCVGWLVGWLFCRFLLLLLFPLIEAVSMHEENLSGKSWMCGYESTLLTSGGMPAGVDTEVTRLTSERKIIRSWERIGKIYLLTTWRNNTTKRTAWQTLCSPNISFCVWVLSIFLTNVCSTEVKATPIMTQTAKKTDWHKHIAAFFSSSLHSFILYMLCWFAKEPIIISIWAFRRQLFYLFEIKKQHR